MHILFLTWKDPKHPHAGGAEKVMYEYAHGLVSKGHEVTWFASSFTGAQSEEIIDGIRVIRKYRDHTIWLSAWTWYRGFRKIHTPDIIIDEAGGWPPLSTLYEKILPIYFFIHHIPEKEFDIAPFPLNSLIRKLYYSFISLYRDTPTITVSESTKSELIRDFGFQEDGITVIENTTDVVPIEKIDWDKRGHDIVFLGRLTQIKRPDHAIRAFARVLDALPLDTKLHIIGNRQDSQYVDSCERLASELGVGERVIFQGFLSSERYSEILMGSRCILVPSEKEGYGLIVLEANAHGLPAIAYDVAGLRDSVKAGENGILVPDGDIESMASLLGEMFANEESYRILAEKSLEHAKQIPKWSEQVDKFETLLIEKK